MINNRKSINQSKYDCFYDSGGGKLKHSLDNPEIISEHAANEIKTSRVLPKVKIQQIDSNTYNNTTFIVRT